MNESIKALIAKWRRVAGEATLRSADGWSSADRQFENGESAALWACAKELEELYKQSDLVDELIDTLDELADLVEAAHAEDYEIDSLTTQPARRVLARAEREGLCKQPDKESK